MVDDRNGKVDLVTKITKMDNATVLNDTALDNIKK